MSEEAKYEIVDIHLDGLVISKFTLLELGSNKRATASYNDVITLARNNKIKNASAFLDITSGSYLLNVDGGVNNLPVHKTVDLTLTSRIISNNKCIGYKAKDISGRTFTISIEKIWELASIGCVKGVTAQINNGRKVLLSNDSVLLKELPILKE